MKNVHCVSLGIVLLGSAFLVLGCHTSSPATHGDGAAGDAGAAAGGNGGTLGGQGGTAGSTAGLDGGGVGGNVVVGSAQCSNGKDDDLDGFIDSLDPQCTGPLDNDESGFATGIPGDNIDACKQDCFFDGNSGMGDDGCEWNLKCDPLSPGANAAKACPYDSTFKNCPTTQSAKCISNCRTITPNGCDCFGCCDIVGATTPIRLQASCTQAKLTDSVACPPCTKVTACNNTCERCELCVGKTTLPADCAKPTDGGTTDGSAPPPTPVCPDGQVTCGPNGLDPSKCPAATNCITGCCVPIIVP
jgi:hypothetical protein